MIGCKRITQTNRYSTAESPIAVALRRAFLGGRLQHFTALSIAGVTQPIGKPPLVRVIKEVTEAFMITFLFIAVLAVLGFLSFTSPDGVAGPRHRH